ncbi:CAP-GLY domain-containing linker protein 1 [Gamsiella multidivaricata]|nr:CAP-GLY domain-containing linker protein 1 [Gamsiella multidivaricata]
MAPKTPQANSKLPKAPSAGGPIPLTGLPAPSSVLQRRSFMPTPGAGSVSKALKDMSPEQQALLAEAISIHSPGLIDPGRRTSAPGASPAYTTKTNGSGFGGAGPGSGYQLEQGPRTTSPSAFGLSSLQHNARSISPASNGDRASPTGLSSPASYRAPTSQPTQLGRRASYSRLSTHAESPLAGVHSATTNTATMQQISRPPSYSGISPSPLSTSHPSLSSMSSSTPSPTTPVGAGRPTPGSPSGARPALTSSRLSAGPGTMSGAIGGGTRTGLMKQPLFQRPPGTAAVAAPVQPAKNPLAAVPGPPAIAPPSLDNYEIGDHVVVESMDLSGILRFLGPTEFKSGTWAGIELDTPTGKNDGSVGGVTYFQCKPKYGIFVLAAKIAKPELLFPSTPDLSIAHPLPAQEESPAPAPAPATPTVNNHAVQAASKITAGSRASKYIGMTATQLKQRNGAPQPATPRISTPAQSNSSLAGASARAASPTIRALSGMNGSPTSNRTIPPGATNARANSPSPVPKPLFRSSSPTARSATGNRLSQQPAGKPTLATLNSKPAVHSRSTSSTSSVTSQSSANGTRARTSPTPRSMTAPRRLSSRSETPDLSGLISPNESRPTLLDQASAIQMAGSPQDNVSLQLQQLQLDFDTAVAENNMLKSEISETKSQLETSKLLEKRDLSYEERTFLSKSLGHEVITERLGQELEDLHAMKAAWDKERATKDQELKVVTDKMTQLWLDTARSQKERTALIQEKTELAEKLKQLEENGGVAVNDENIGASSEHQTLIESLQASLREADEKTVALEAKLQDLSARAMEEEEKLNRMNEESKAINEAKVQELESERDGLHAKVAELEATSKTALEEMESRLKEALEEALVTKAQLNEAQTKLEEEAEYRRLSESESNTKLKAAEVELQESQNLLAKSEKLVRGLEDKTKEYEATIVKREEDVASLKLELQDIGGMVQSEEVDRMRKVWELEKKRLEEAVADNITIMTTLRSEIQTLETNQDELYAQIKTLEASETSLKELKSAAELETVQAQKAAKDAEEVFAQERTALEAKIAESQLALESRLSEVKERMEDLEAIALTVEEWRERCEAMQLEMIQKTAAVEDLGLKLADVQAQADVLRQENVEIKAKLEMKVSADQTAALESSRVEIVALEEEREQLLSKVSELEAALALSVSAPRATSSSTADSEAVLNRAELEEEIAGLKQMVHELTAENAVVASDNKKLMQEHDILMEAHKHVETECLKLMDEVERLHSESLAVTSIGESEVAEKGGLDMIHIETGAKAPLIGQEELKAALSNVSVLTKDTSILAPSEKQSGQNQSASVIRLESLLKDKQTMLDRLTQAHSLEMRDLRQRYVDLDRAKAYEIGQLNKELTDLESLIESKIFHEADLEEEVQMKQKEIDRLQLEIADLKSQLASVSNGTHGSLVDLPSNGLSSDWRPNSSNAPHVGSRVVAKSPLSNERTRTEADGTDKALFCEICEVEGHDLIGCVAVFGSGKSAGGFTPSVPATSAPSYSEADLEDERPYCDNCEEFGQHYTDECPNESLTY